MSSLSFCLQLASIITVILLSSSHLTSTLTREPLHIPLRIAAPHLSETESPDATLAFESWATQAGTKLNSRYGGESLIDTQPSESKPSLHARQVANVRLINAFSDAIYAAPVSIGTPPQSFHVGQISLAVAPHR